MKPRLSLLVFAGLLALGALTAAADQDAVTVAQDAVATPQIADVGPAGCAEATGTEADASLDLDLFLPEPLSLVKGSCGSCSSHPCAGRTVGSPCGIINGEYTWCIPPLTTHCPGGGSNNWDCRCASQYL